MSESSPALLLLERVRIDAGGAIACENLSTALDGARVVLVGDGAAAIAAAMTMTGEVVGGSMTFDGHDVPSRSHVGSVGLVPSDMPLVPRMTVAEYVATSFRLANVPGGEADRAATAALHDAGLAGLAGRKTESLAPPERKVVLLAQAMAPGVKSLFVETPLGGLEGPAARYVIDVLQRVATTRRWAATAAHGDADAPERELMMACDRVAIVGRSEVVWEGDPGALMNSGTVYAVAVRGEVEGFRAALIERGFILRGAGARFAATVPASGSAAEIVETALRCGAAVVELAPVLPAGR